MKAYHSVCWYKVGPKTSCKQHNFTYVCLNNTCIYIYIYMVAPPPGTYLFQFYTLFTVFKASPVKGFEGTGIPYSL